MTSDQKKVLRMAIEASCGGNQTEPPNGEGGKAMIMRVLGLSGWPASGFDNLSRDILYYAIADEWPKGGVSRAAD